jgi:valyl-tRNA synthetase
VAALRQIRSDYNVAPAKQVDAVLTAAPSGSAARVLAEERALIGRLARAAVVVGAAPDAAAAHKVLPGGSEAYVLLAGIVDLDRECKRARDELAGLEKQLGGLRQRLANESFLARAKPEVVEAERQKEREWGARREQLARKVASLCGAE